MKYKKGGKKVMNNANKKISVIVLTAILVLTAFAFVISVSATSSVPADVASIIANKCAGCHVPAPSSHPSDRAGQCGSCHVPYANTATPAHTSTTTGCTDCHTLEKTHFHLRDEDDQTVFAANAEDKCISCHRDGNEGAKAAGRGYPPLVTDEDIVAAAEKGTLRSWIQPGGFMAKYLTDNEVTTITNWIDTVSANRSLDYDPYLDAVKIDSDFDINGLGDNPAWASALEHVVSVHPTIYTAADNVKLKALYSDKYLYIRAEYKDPTASLTRSGSWILNDDGTWRHPIAATENDKQSEDRFSIIWNINTPNFKERYGCAIKCHGNVPGSSEYTDLPGSIMDIWHSKAGRGLGLYSATDSRGLTIDTATESFEVTAGTVHFKGTCDDKWLTSYMADHHYTLEDSGRVGDAGKSAYGRNRNADKSAPKYIEVAPTSWADAMALTQAEVDNGETIVADPAADRYNAADVAAAFLNYENLGAVVPERILRTPEGSRGDVLHAAVWKDGVWINEFRRAMTTGSPDDVQFDLANAKDYEFSLAIFDNCGRGELPPGHTTYGDGQSQVLRFVIEAAPTATPTPTPTPPVPGFEAVFAIFGSLAVAYLVLRREE